MAGAAGAPRRAAGWRALVAGPALPFWFATVVLHDPVQELFSWGAEAWGVAGLAWRVGLVGAALGLPLVAAEVRAAWSRFGTAGLWAWAFWGAASSAAGLALTQTRAELVHLPQYALVAWLVAGAGLAPTAALLTCLGLGALDEAWQWRVLYPERAMDWNDVTLDLVGALAGVLTRVRAEPRP